MTRRTIGLALVIAAVAAALALGALRLINPPRSAPPTLAVGEALGGSTEGFARALAPRPFVFPADHGPHDEFRTEWWYYTGNLHTAAGRHFGFQLTFFRIALAPTMAERASAWASRQVYMAHFALTDTAAGRFSASSRLSRAALGLAGAQAQPFKVWVEDWSAEGVGEEAVPVRLRAAHEGAVIDLTLASAKPVALQGDHGFDRKGEEPGNASYYYSFTRMPATGRVTIGGARFDVTGLAWMDREWSTSSLGPGVVGWDWIALQLDDGRDLMLYRLRRADGSADRFSSGSVVAADGATRRLGRDDVAVEARESWTSPRDGTRYPSRWRVAIPSEALVLDVVPRLADQELVLGVRYWEGAVRVEGRARDRPIAGAGYVELVGYAREGAGPRAAVRYNRQVTPALLFDLGGTLDADGRPWKSRFRELYRAYGVDPSDALFDRVFYAADDALLGKLAGGLRETVECLADGVSAGLGVTDARVTAHVGRRFAEAAVARLSVSRRLLARLRGRYRLGLVSNFYGNLDAVCAEAGLADLFEVIVDSTRVGVTKPDPRIFRHATDTLGVDPADATFVGDSPSRDMAGARDLGMAHVWLTPDPSAKPCCPGDHVIASLADLERCVLRAAGRRGAGAPPSEAST